MPHAAVILAEDDFCVVFSKEIAETTKIGLRTVQRIIKNWKDSGREPSSSRKKCGWKKILIDRDQRSVWWNQIVEKQQ